MYAPDALELAYVALAKVEVVAGGLHLIDTPDETVTQHRHYTRVREK